jgi:hypothetical protein
MSPIRWCERADSGHGAPRATASPACDTVIAAHVWQNVWLTV